MKRLLVEHVDRMLRRSYDRIAPRYARGSIGPKWQKDQFARLMHLLPPGGRVLDLGCGSGRVLQYFRRFGFRVTGIDQSPRMVIVSRRRVPAGRFFNRNMVKPGFRDASFDGSVSTFAIIHVPHAKQPEVFRHMARLLAPGGHFLITLSDYTGIREYVGDHCGESMYWSGVALRESFRRMRRVELDILWHRELGPRDDRNIWILGRKPE